MLDMFLRAPWGELHTFFAKGEPPLAFQFLILNTIFFIFFISRRMRGLKTMRTETASTIQSLLIFTNGLILFQDYIKIPHF